jgi:glucokinase
MKLLAADLGGTKSNLWLFEQDGTRRRILNEATLASADHADACSVVQAFLRGARVGAASVAIAGPVVDGRTETPNLPWVVEQAGLARALGTERVELINDLVATACGIAELPQDALATLNEGTPSAGTVAVIAAGTGLGEAVLVHAGTRQIALASEGGHADFAPGDEVEIELLRHLAARHGHVSWERVVSGPGLHAIYEFLVESGRGKRAPGLAARMKAGDPSAAIADAALAGADATASAALDLFARAYGSEAGNLALKVLATGGVYVAGGIAPKILARLRAGLFLRGFLAKGRHSELLERMPVKVVLEPKTALFGSARRATELASA